MGEWRAYWWHGNRQAPWVPPIAGPARSWLTCGLPYTAFFDVEKVQEWIDQISGKTQHGEEGLSGFINWPVIRRMVSGGHDVYGCVPRTKDDLWAFAICYAHDLTQPALGEPKRESPPVES